MERLRKHDNWRKTWSVIVPGNFDGNGYTDLLSYDPIKDEGEICIV
ncbi:MAG: hypothetical protein HXS48_18865 [Theionarchaea archaeon]|nr:hypothetical protein [Theionarchaea archaeon]